MTYRRGDTGWAQATTRVMRAVGEGELAAAIGIRARSWLRACANPMQPGRLLSIEAAAIADIEAAKRGAGTPHFEEFTRRLIEAGAIESAAAGPARWTLLLRGCAYALRGIADRLAAAAEPNGMEVAA